MKLKSWLRDYKETTYSEYKELPEIDKHILYGEFMEYNRQLQKKAQVGWRPMTDEERKWADNVGEQGKKRYAINLKIGGVDERENYTALHHRWEEK